MISSTSNPRIKAIRKLADSKERSATNTFLAEGLRVVGQAVDSDVHIQELLYCEDLLISDYGKSLVEKLKQNTSVEIIEVSKEVFESLARKDKPQGIAAVIRQKWADLNDFSSVDRGIWVALEAVQNPGNLGTVLRTCDAVGAKGLLLLDHSTDPYDPAAVRASMGAIFTKTLVKSTLNDVVNLVNHDNIFSVATSDAASVYYRELRYHKDMLLVMGSERQGLPQEVLAKCNEVVKIPMLGSCDSLNLAVATGVVLYEILNQVQTG